ncbi:NAD(P)/FAD-dependent oxidoreductase [Oceanospirillum beijerinckii]|uniref:NAD(P)/FAD-dependent oxidoreductase n=1 Tax=Oceanospirillum beijerinckii TaxID=64976 RepID=UPI000484B9AD|nr:tryptophan 7-halogenase [Oceanospirillum beijerinckii]
MLMMTDLNTAARHISAEQQAPLTIAIIGGGPAGLASAIFLRSKLSADCSILLFDSQKEDKLKVGESIPPAATPVLRKLFGEQLKSIFAEHLECPGSISLWGSDTPGHNDFIFELDGAGYHLNRTLFEQQLKQRVLSAGVVCHDQYRLCNIEPNNSGFTLEFATAEGNQQWDADFVVDASGAGSFFTRKLGVARNILDSVLFLCAEFDLPDSIDMLDHTLVEAVSDGWWYSARLPHNRLMVTFCTDAEHVKLSACDQAEFWLEKLKQTSWLQSRIPMAEIAEQMSETTIITRAATSFIMSNVIGERWLAVGDAACGFDPISSAGITKALLQSERASSAISEWAGGSMDALSGYQDQVFNDFNQYVGLRSQLYASETRFAGQRYWSQRVF